MSFDLGFVIIIYSHAVQVGTMYIEGCLEILSGCLFYFIFFCRILSN